MDSTAPDFSTDFPSDTRAEAQGPGKDTPVTYTTPTATDNVDQDVTITCAPPPSGSTFDLGNTTVTCNAKDDSNNMKSQSFTVSVGE